MRVLFDQGTPVPLRRFLAEHEVATAFELGWSEISNGELLAKAEKQFDVLITTDRQLRYQQNLTGRAIAIVVLPYASWIKLDPHAQTIASAIDALQPGSYVEIELG
jgi:predicted nuclease of predicted toxin-antitoxin system